MSRIRDQELGTFEPLLLVVGGKFLRDSFRVALTTGKYNRTVH